MTENNCGFEVRNGPATVGSPTGLVLSLCDRQHGTAVGGGRLFLPDRDIQKTTGEISNVTRIQTDVRRFLPPRTTHAAVFAFTPCTHLAVSGARWFKEKGIHGLTEALEIAEACVRICE